MGAWVVLEDGPATTQLASIEHEIEFSVQSPAGMASDCQVAPPSDVEISNTPSDELLIPVGSGPIATQSSAEEHDTARSTPVPPSTARGLHDSPPSVLTRT
jgi:hypothetical protein